MDVKLTKEQFTELYLDTTRTTKQLAEYLGVSENKVIRAAKDLGLSRRKPSNRLIIEG